MVYVAAILAALLLEASPSRGIPHPVSNSSGGVSLSSKSCRLAESRSDGGGLATGPIAPRDE